MLKPRVWAEVLQSEYSHPIVRNFPHSGVLYQMFTVVTFFLFPFFLLRFIDIWVQTSIGGTPVPWCTCGGQRITFGE